MNSMAKNQDVIAETARVHYRTIDIDGLEIFYRKAGPKDAPVLLLLHGFPTSSHMFRDLIPLLADQYRVIAPDYPGFGYSSTPPVDDFDYLIIRNSHPAIMIRYGRGFACSPAHIRRSVMVSSW